MKPFVQGAALLALTGSLTALAAAQDLQPRMGDPLPGLSQAELDLFFNGRDVFDLPLSPADGRGPLFNDSSCNGCHILPVSGGGGSKFVTRFGKAATDTTPFDPLENLGGSLLHAFGNTPECEEHLPPEANVVDTRITPPCFGFGLIEAIDDADIVANFQNQPVGLSGELHIVQPLEGGPQRVGRFGWKAQVATVLSFSADASLNEMGMTNRLLGQENAPNGDLVKLAACDTVADPEDVTDAQGLDRIDHMTNFQRGLAPPPQTPKSGMTGELLFNQIGCAGCHATGYVTKTVPGDPAVSNKTIQPYSDFLLHDIGTGDGIWQGTATGAEFRSTPLWGILVRAQTALLHNGSVNSGTPEDNLRNAILAHGNEALASRNAFEFNLSATQQDQLIAFLTSLGQLEFDFERNHQVDEFDWFFIQPMITGPVATYTPDDFESINDVDQDQDFDLRDIGAFQRAISHQ